MGGERGGGETEFNPAVILNAAAFSSRAWLWNQVAFELSS
jgi:hypothetical protein